MPDRSPVRWIRSAPAKAIEAELSTTLYKAYQSVRGGDRQGDPQTPWREFGNLPTSNGGIITARSVAPWAPGDASYVVF